MLTLTWTTWHGYFPAKNPGYQHYSDRKQERAFRSFCGKQEWPMPVFSLEHTTLPIQEISDLCGIGDYFYFAKLFRKTMGVTATRYREQKQCLT